MLCILFDFPVIKKKIFKKIIEGEEIKEKSNVKCGFHVKSNPECKYSRIYFLS